MRAAQKRAHDFATSYRAVTVRAGHGGLLQQAEFCLFHPLKWYGMQILMTMALVAAVNGVVLKPVANMHSRPSEEADVVSQAIYASNLRVLEEQDGWARVRTADDYTGWMPLSSLRSV